VLNFGVNGYSPLQELLVLQREGPRYQPDLVMVGLFLDNDVSGCHPSLSTVQEQSPFATFDDDKITFDHSRAEDSFRDYHAEPIHTIRKFSAIYRWFRAMNQRRAGVNTSTIPTRYMLYSDPSLPIWDEAWSNVEKVLLELAAETERQEAKLLIVSLPCGQAVHPQSWQNVQQQHPAMLARKWDLERPERQLMEFANRHNLLILQLLPTFQHQGKDSSLFFGNVGHMNADGHNLTGKSIASFVEQRGLLPEAGLSAEKTALNSGRQ
jgi:hypothetical protein